MARPTMKLENAKIIQMANAGAKDGEIAGALGVAQDTIRQRRYKLGLPTWAAIQREKMVKRLTELHAAKLTDAEMALCMGLKKNTVMRARHDLGLKPNPSIIPKGLPPGQAYERKIERNRLWQAKQAGKDISEITPRQPQAREPAPTKIELRERIRPIARALGKIYAMTPDVDVQAALSVAMQRHAGNPAFAAAWALEVRV